MLGIWELFQNYLNTTPPDVVATDIIIYVGWFPVFCVLIWGFLQIWMDIKQGEYWANLKWDLLAITIPADAIHSVKGIENFFNNLSGSKSQITWKEKWLQGKFQAYFSFEIVSNGGQIQYYIRTIKKYRDLVEAALYAQYPDAQIIEVEDYINQIPDDYPHEEYDCFGSEMSLSKKQYFPLKRYVDFEHAGEKDLRFKDPLLPMLEMLGKMRPGEHYWIQMLIIGPDSQDWKKEAIKWMKKMYGIEEQKKTSLFDEAVGWIPGAFVEQAFGVVLGGAQEKKTDDFRMWKMTPDEQDTLRAVGEKQKEIGWISKIRFVYVAKKELFRKGTIASMSKGIFLQYDSGMNKLSLTENVTTKDDYFFQAWQMPGRQRKLVERYKNRLFGGTTPYILTASELATLWHFPGPDARTPVLTSLGSKMGEAPIELGFAENELSILPNIERSSPDTEGSVLVQKTTAPLFVADSPTPKPPTKEQEDYPNSPRPDSIVTEVPKESFEKLSVENNIPEFKPGMPAPLPPGLDLSDIAVSESEPPESLPI